MNSHDVRNVQEEDARLQGSWHCPKDRRWIEDPAVTVLNDRENQRSAWHRSENFRPESEDFEGTNDSGGTNQFSTLDWTVEIIILPSVVCLLHFLNHRPIDDRIC
jgi:hypothetical protein